MNAVKVELLIVNHDKVSEQEIQDILENARYPNRCINPQVVSVKSVDIGEWEDSNPLNNRNTFEAEYKRLFGGVKS